MTIEIRDIQLKKLFRTARKLERQHGKSIEEILVEIIYENFENDPMTSLEGIKVVYSYIFNSDIDADWFDAEEKPGELIPLDGGDDSE